MQQSLFCSAGKGPGIAAAPRSERLPRFGARLEASEHTPHAQRGQDTGPASHPRSLQSRDVTREQRMPRYLKRCCCCCLETAFSRLFLTCSCPQKGTQVRILELSNKGCTARFHSPHLSSSKASTTLFQEEKADADIR